MGGFSNPVTNAAGQLVRNVMKSINYVAGLTGWQISKNGDAEFNLGTFRGSISITGSNGSRIVIDASQPYPTMFFYSKDGTNYSQLSLINAISNSAADFWISSGQWSPAIDSIPRAIRLYLSGAQNDHARFSVDRVSDGGAMGGRFSVHVDKALMAYRNDSAVPAQIYELVISNTGSLTYKNKPICTSVSSMGPQFHTLGSTVDSGYSLMPGSPGFSFTKEYGTNTHILIAFHSTFYVNGAAGVTFGVNVQGSGFNGNFTMAQIANTNAANVNHTQASGSGRISVGQAGTFTISPIWLRQAGAGTVQVDSGDYFSVVATEVAA